MNQAILQYFPVVLLWSAVAYKLPALRRNPRDPALRAYWLTLVSFALALTVLLAPVYVAIDTLSGVPNLARLLANETDLHFDQISAIFSGVADLKKVFEVARQRRSLGRYRPVDRPR